ncbi:two pore domain potassium channel family protein [Thalassotalea sp. M1531]|uniref:Two pore domain potassium channel family protein n=1 Tax=Thalassotalea algicola TaxID=2716224 RepID=A0A7Y0LC53_9GAMM|nr:two pore domain potassium channel family protein [Thalassotalea algicola]
MSHHDNFIYLTFALVLLLLSTAIAQQFFEPSAQRFVQSTTVITLLVAVWGIKKDEFLLAKAFIFPVAIILTSFAGFYLDEFGLEFTHLILMLIFFVSTAYQTARQVIFSGEINGNKILGAICLYMLLGLIWALLYTLSQLYFGQAFNGMPEATQWYIAFPDFVYFSFVTLTTLGFGDISPNLPITRFLVYFQAVFGQFYLAVLVASLVSSRKSPHQNGNNSTS